MLEGGAGFNSELFGIARTLVRAAEEMRQAERASGCREFRDADLESLKLQLFSDDADLRRFRDRQAGRRR